MKEDEFKERLKKLESAIKELCNHKEFVIGYYEFRTRSFTNGFICTDCGKFLKATN